jgi:hypothetical protein
MDAIGTRNTAGISRRTLAKTLSGAAAAALLPAPATAAEEPALPSGQKTEERTEALVEAALSATPAGLTAEQRLDVRRGVRDLQKALADARKAKLDYGVEPVTVFLPEGRR